MVVKAIYHFLFLIEFLVEFRRYYEFTLEHWSPSHEIECHKNKLVPTNVQVTVTTT